MAATTTPRKKIAAPPRKSAAKKAPVKKVPAKVAAVKKAAAVKRAPAKKAAPAVKTPKKKLTPKKAAELKAAEAAKRAAERKARKASGESYWETNEHGFRVGSDTAIIVDAMLAGGKDRDEVTANAVSNLGTMTTRNGQRKNVPSLMSALLAKLAERGYVVESHWVLKVPSKKGASS